MNSKIKKSYQSISARHHHLRLILKGADVVQVKSTVFYVKIKVGKVDLEYMYSLDDHDQYFLQRVKPYSEVAPSYCCEEEVIKAIEIDIEQFKNAVKSKCIQEFVKINQELNKTIAMFEDLFLYYQVPKMQAEEISKKIEEIKEIILNAKEVDKRVFFDKNPEALK